MSGYEYTLTMSKEQAHEVLNAVELLMRLKLNQYEVLPYTLINLDDPEYCEKRDDAIPLLRAGFNTLYRGKRSDEWKDQQWHRLYDLYQVLRKAIHDAEHPDTIGVDSGPVMCTAGEPMAKCEWGVKND